MDKSTKWTRSLEDPWHHGHWFYLFHALILLLLLYPYLEQPAEESRPLLLVVINTIIVVSIIFAASRSLRQLVVAFLIGLPTIVLYWLPQIPYDSVLVILFSVVLYLYAILMIFLNLIRSHEISSEEIYGATSLYLLLGLTWAYFFQLIEWFYPGSFYLGPQYNVDLALTWSDFLYYSFTTLTTLGYGGMVPISSQARSLAIIEAVTVVIVVAAMISGAIGIYISQRLLKLKRRLEKIDEEQSIR